MRIIPLGVNGFIPTFGRHTTSFLVLTDREAILLDAGTGAARLFEPDISALLDSYSELHILLSHYHLDHILGLSYLAAAPASRPIFIHAPAPPLVDGDPYDSLHSLLSPPFFSLPLNQFPMPVRIVPIEAERFAIGEFVVGVRRQIHPGGSIGIRVGDLAFMTDTAVDEAAIRFISGAKLLLHEVWLRDEDVVGRPGDLNGHSFLSGVTTLAKNAGVPQVMPIHLHPQRTRDEVAGLTDAISQKGVRVLPPEERRVYELA